MLSLAKRIMIEIVIKRLVRRIIMNISHEKKIKTLRKMNTYEQKLGTVWGWIQNGPMTFKQFKQYIKQARTPNVINEDPEITMA
jgi:hypothetical protein